MPESGQQIAEERIQEALDKKNKELSLSGIDLQEVPSSIQSLAGLKTLNLSNNPNLSSLPCEISEIESLQSIDIRNTDIQELPSEFLNLHKLDFLCISQKKGTNNLETLLRNISNFPQIERILIENCSKLPTSLYSLKNLTSLNIRNGEFSNISAKIGNLCELVSLSISNTNLVTLPPAIGKLSKLKILDVSFNKIKELPKEIKNLSSLEILIISGNQITEIPSEIGYLNFLQVLEVGTPNTSSNNLLSAIVDTTDIISVDSAIGTTIGILLGSALLPGLGAVIGAGIGALSNYITKKSRSSNQITKLPEEILHLRNLKRLNLTETALPVPPEILENVDDPYAITNFYFALGLETNISDGHSKFIKAVMSNDQPEIIDGVIIDEVPEQPISKKISRPLNELKILVVGQGAVGKTSISTCLLCRPFNQNQIKTDGISIDKWELGNEVEKFQINLWDFGGQEIMHATHQFFLTKRSLYLLVLDSRLTQEENRVEYWLKIIQSFGDESPVLIIGNKIDQHPLDIDRTGLQKKYSNIVGVLETSAATGTGIEELKAAITKQVNNLPHIHDLLPETWFTVKNKLEEFGREKNYISRDKYIELCAQNDVNDETSQRTLIGFLHDLGVVLHFQDDPRLEALGILNPQWVTNGVYKILNSHTLFQNKGVLTLSMLNEILNIDGYPRDKRLFIIDMMKKFELCYDLESDKSFLVPDLLPKDEPPLTFHGIPAFEYAYPILPSSVITRFIVRMNQHICGGCVWRTGVLLQMGNNTALVKADIEDKKITIAIDGLEHTRRDALSAIRYQLDEIHASIKGLNPQKMVPIPNAPKAEPVEYEYLLMLEREGQEIYLAKDGNRLVKVNIREILSGVISEAERKHDAGTVTNIYIGGDVKDSTIISGDENEVNR